MWNCSTSGNFWLQRVANSRMDAAHAFAQPMLYQPNYEATPNDVRTFRLRISGYPPILRKSMASTTVNVSAIWLPNQDFPLTQLAPLGRIHGGRLVEKFGWASSYRSLTEMSVHRSTWPGSSVVSLLTVQIRELCPCVDSNPVEVEYSLQFWVLPG